MGGAGNVFKVEEGSSGDLIDMLFKGEVDVKNNSEEDRLELSMVRQKL